MMSCRNLHRLLCMLNGILLRQSAGSHCLQKIVMAGSNRFWTVSVAARYDRSLGQQEAKISGLVHTLWWVLYEKSPSYNPFIVHFISFS